MPGVFKPERVLQVTAAMRRQGMFWHKERSGGFVLKYSTKTNNRARAHTKFNPRLLPVIVSVLHGGNLHERDN